MPGLKDWWNKLFSLIKTFFELSQSVFQKKWGSFQVFLPVQARKSPVAIAIQK